MVLILYIWSFWCINELCMFKVCRLSFICGGHDNIFIRKRLEKEENINGILENLHKYLQINKIELYKIYQYICH